MSKTLKQIALDLNSPRTVKKKVTQETQVIQTVPKVQLIYAFNGTGKTLLSREFKELIFPKNALEDPSQRKKILYYNAFTEDLFYWNNDLINDTDLKLQIQPNSFTDWILREQEKDYNVISNFQRYVNDKLTPRFNQEYKIKIKDKGSIEEKEVTIPAFSEVTFSYQKGDNTNSGPIKISKGEESNFIWSIFYTLLEEVISTLNTSEEIERNTDRFNELEYIFIDDPVSSLDENHLIELAVDLANLIRSSESEKLKFIITTHNPLFYNVLYNELNGKTCYLLERLENGTFYLQEKNGDTDSTFFYHLHIRQILANAITTDSIEKFHFSLIRNLYEKVASFLGYKHWSDLLDTVPGNKDSYLKMIINFNSHRTLSGEEASKPSAPEKQTIKLLFENLNRYATWKVKE